MLPTLTFADYVTDRTRLEELTDQLQHVLAHQRACIIQGFPVEEQHQTLKAMVHQLGRPLLEARNIDGGMVYPVTPDRVSPTPAYVDTPYTFDCHTDCAEFKHVPEGVVLLCETPAESGGDTLWVDLEDILPELSYETLLQLQKPVFNFRIHKAPILRVNPLTEHVEIRYHGAMLALTDSLAEEVGFLARSPELLAACEELESKAQEKTQQFKLATGDCLVLDNTRSLHGRTAFSGHRLLKRVRFRKFSR